MFCFGSLADVGTPTSESVLPLNSGHARRQSQCPLCAISRPHPGVFARLSLNTSNMLGACEPSRLRFRTSLKRKRHVKHATVPLNTHRQATTTKHRKHRLIFGEHICFKPRQASRLRKKRKMPEQKARDPLTSVSRWVRKASSALCGRSTASTAKRAPPSKVSTPSLRDVTTNADTWLKSTSVSCLSSASESSFFGLKKRR